MAPMKTQRIIPIALAGLALGGAAGTATAASSPTATTAAGRHVEGKVLSVNRDARTFRLRDSERGTFRIKVTRSTDFERLSGFSALHQGSRNIEATIKRSNGRWVAVTVERSGGGGNHGGNGADDAPGTDDHGSGGHGADDAVGHA
jgi:hypothetical protein